MFAGTHVCAVYSEPAERNKVGLAFRQEGRWSGDGYLGLTDHMASAWMPAVGCRDSEVRPASDVCLDAGRFSADRMTTVLVDLTVHLADRGCPHLRVMVETGWLLQQPGAMDELVLYETAADDVVGQVPAVLLCVYDLHCLSAEMLATVLSAHRAVFLDGTLLVNPHWRAETEFVAVTGFEEGLGSTPGARSGEAQQAPTGDRWGSLTGSERRIVAHVVAGLTNRETASELVISRHTVDAHLKHIYIKLGIHTRVELAVLALQHSAA